jgi:hypothetical protein
MGGDGEVGGGADQDFFEAADELDYAQGFARAFRTSLRLVRANQWVRPYTGEAAEIEDGVAYDLAGAVEGDVSAAVAFEEFDAALRQEFGARDYVRGFRVAAQGDYWLVFQEEENVADLFFFAERDEFLLQGLADGVVDGAELD